MVDLEFDDELAVLTIDSPDARNAIPDTMISWRMHSTRWRPTLIKRARLSLTSRTDALRLRPPMQT